MLEAVCGECGETFIPEDENDTIHEVTVLGKECGGQGVITGEWIFQRKVDLSWEFR